MIVSNEHPKYLVLPAGGPQHDIRVNHLPAVGEEVDVGGHKLRVDRVSHDLGLVNPGMGRLVSFAYLKEVTS